MANKKNSNKAKERFKFLQLAKQLGNISEAAKQCKVDRKRFYIWRERYKQYGIKGLEDKLPTGRKPQLKQSVIKKVINIAVTKPYNSSRDIEIILKKEKIYLSRTSIQGILNENKLGNLKLRWLIYGEHRLNNGLKLSLEDLKKLSFYNKKKYSKLYKKLLKEKTDAEKLKKEKLLKKEQKNQDRINKYLHKEKMAIYSKWILFSPKNNPSLSKNHIRFLFYKEINFNSQHKEIQKYVFEMINDF